MEWRVRKFSQLTTTQLYTILKLRMDIFVVEQACAYPELDGYDADSIHLWLEAGGEVITYSRLVPPNSKYKQASIGRVLVHPEHRGHGYARLVMEKSIAWIKEEWGVSEIFLQGQEHLRSFYESCGFEAISETYLDDDIPHRDMLMTLN
ncbi:GNAT family N-acetyltransferase [Thalassobacillus sp. CUG 92003]|uniref:GNAT family N-acetyltransferase n=1 Tax=Thalassobacillus sp. CUG 92003 TaxID=2736641 RepID=UPI0015E71F69